MTAPKVGGRVGQAIVAFALFVCIGASNGPSPLYVIYQREWHLASVTLTEVFSVYAVGVLASLLIAGPLSDRKGRKPMLFVAVGLLFASIALLLTAHDVAWLFAGRFLQGLATGTITGGAAAAIVELDPDDNHRRASILTTATFLAGSAFMPLLTGVMAEYAPDPTVLPFVAELVFCATAALLLPLVPESRLPSRTARAGGRSRLTVQWPRVPRSIRGRFAIAGGAVALGWAVGSLYAALSGSIESALLHIESHAAAGLWLFVYNGLGGVGQIGMQRWANRSALMVGIGGVTLGMAAVQASSMLHAAFLFYVGTFVAGVGGGAAFMGAMAVINAIAPPADRAGVVSAFSVVSYLAVAVPVMGVGILSDSIGLDGATGVFLAVVACAAVPLLVVIAGGSVRTVPAPATVD